jgi:hypothetical protein
MNPGPLITDQRIRDQRLIHVGASRSESESYGLRSSTRRTVTMTLGLEKRHGGPRQPKWESESESYALRGNPHPGSACHSDRLIKIA